MRKSPPAQLPCGRTLFYYILGILVVYLYKLYDPVRDLYICLLLVFFLQFVIAFFL